MVAALALVALGEEESALLVLLETVRQFPGQAEKAPTVQRWLPEARVVETFETLVKESPAPEVLQGLTLGLRGSAHPQTDELLWRLLGMEEADAELAGMVTPALTLSCKGENYSRETAAPGQRKRIVEAAGPRVGGGSEYQRVVALALLASADDEEGAKAARPIFEAVDVEEELRLDALCILLVCQPKRKADALAVESLSSSITDVRRRSLLYLTEGPRELTTLREGPIWLSQVLTGTYSTSAPARGTVQPPEGLKPESLDPLLEDEDSATAARAAYLLVLLKDRSRLPLVLDYWREHERDDDAWRRMAYLAVASVGDASQTPVLEEIHGTFEKDDLRPARVSLGDSRDVWGQSPQAPQAHPR